jgi:peptidoglycan/xylan/chitin deacetylase (PgdA/CDA1 family)
MNGWQMIVPPACGIAASIAAWGAVSPTAQLFGSTVRYTNRRSAIALTFDDGPNPAVTPRLLDLLQRHRVAASFFVLGRFARMYPQIMREIAAAGNAIGNHTEHHRNLTLLSGDRIVDELSRCQQSIVEALDGQGNAPRWMRPPYGFRGPQLSRAVRRAGLRGIAMWSVTCYDWKAQPVSRLVNRLAHVGIDARRGALDRKQNGRGGDIVLLHDGDYRQPGADRNHVLAALEHWLPRWRDAGLEFVTIDQIADADAMNA